MCTRFQGREDPTIQETATYTIAGGTADGDNGQEIVRPRLSKGYSRLRRRVKGVGGVVEGEHDGREGLRLSANSSVFYQDDYHGDDAHEMVWVKQQVAVDEGIMSDDELLHDIGRRRNKFGRSGRISNDYIYEDDNEDDDDDFTVEYDADMVEKEDYEEVGHYSSHSRLDSQREECPLSDELVDNCDCDIARQRRDAPVTSDHSQQTEYHGHMTSYDGINQMMQEETLHKESRNYSQKRRWYFVAEVVDKFSFLVYLILLTSSIFTILFLVPVYFRNDK